jgi:hypothetical protein
MSSKNKWTELLAAFAKENKFQGKGPLCVALVVTQNAREQLPLEPKKLETAKGGQVVGLGKAQVQAILKRHGITRVLAEEGGRTSRGSVGNMQTYVKFLNSLARPVNCDAIEKFWIERVRDFFSAKPFKLCVDTSLSIRAAVRELLQQARIRQAELSGSRYEGTMLQHLVGAKLEFVLPAGSVSHHSASEADQAEGRAGDFLVGNVAIHTTTHPGEALLRKCAANLSAGLHPIIVTIPSQLTSAEGLAMQEGIPNRIDVLDIEQFLAANLHEKMLFDTGNRAAKTAELIAKYNAIVDYCETDPSLKIEVVRQ